MRADAGILSARRGWATTLTAGHLAPDLDARVDAVDEHTLLADVELDVVRNPRD